MESNTTHVVEVTDQNFRELIAEGTPLLIDFWAGWCGPCRMVKPEVEKAAIELAGTVTVGAVDVDAHPDIAGSFGVRGIPAFALLKNGKLIEMFSGYMPAAAIVNKVKNKLSWAV